MQWGCGSVAQWDQINWKSSYLEYILEYNNKKCTSWLEILFIQQHNLKRDYLSMFFSNFLETFYILKKKWNINYIPTDNVKQLNWQLLFDWTSWAYY